MSHNYTIDFSEEYFRNNHFNVTSISDPYMATLSGYGDRVLISATCNTNAELPITGYTLFTNLEGAIFHKTGIHVGFSYECPVKVSAHDQSGEHLLPISTVVTRNGTSVDLELRGCFISTSLAVAAIPANVTLNIQAEVHLNL